MDVISERKIRNSQSFRYLQDAYENCLQIKTDLVHSRVAAGLTHGLAISFQQHSSYHTERKNSGAYIAPTLMGIGSNTAKQLGQELSNMQIDQLDSFEKIFLCSQREEYYPVQVCCGYGFSIVLAIEAKNMQWLESIGSSSDNKRDKMEFMQLYSEQIKEALSKTKVFIAGKISARRDDLQSNPVSSVKIDDKKQFFQFPPNSTAGQLLYHQQSSSSQQQNQQQLRKEMSIQSLQHKQSQRINNNPSPFKDQYYNNNNNNNPEQQSLLDPNYNNNNNNSLGLIADFDVDAYSQLSDDDDQESMKKNKDNILFEEQSQYKLSMTETISFPQSKWTPARDLFITQISCGQNFCLALTYNFKVFAWGDNSFGNLGTGDFNSRPTPVLIKFEEGHGKHSKIASINCGHKHAAAVSITGKLYTWGSGPHGQLGQKNILQQSLPCMLKGELEEKTINLVSCGGHHTVCVTNEGYAYSWGMNRNGQLGQGDQRSRTIPTKINWLQNYFIINASCGVNNTFLFTQVGKLFACGNNANNKTGMNTIYTNNAQSSQSQAGQQQKQSLSSSQENWIFPTALDTNFLKGADKSKLKDVYIYQIAASTHFTYSMSNCGLLSTWGLQINGCLGRRISAYVSEGLGGVDKILSNMQVPHTVAAKLGVQINSSSSQQKFFFPIINTQIFKASGKDFISSEIIDIQLGSYHTMALTNAGEVYVWGSNQFGQHGCGQGSEIRLLYQNLRDRRVAQVIPELSKETMPSPVTFFNIQENRRITYITAGAEYCMAIENKRLVFAWGKNNDGQLGIGKIIPYVDTPQMVLGLEGNLMKAIACGETHTLFLTDTGRVYSCGSPKEGKLGLGQRSNTQLQPQLIDQLTKVLEIACGATHSMALVQDSLFPVEEEDENDGNNRNQITKSAIYTWGSSWESKLGHGDKENLAEPTKIQTNFQFKSISAGNHHSAALTLDETLVVWGPFRYFGHTRPDESNKNKKNNSNSSMGGNGFSLVPALTNVGGNSSLNPTGSASNAEYSEFIKPTLHPKIIEKIRYVSLGDKTTLLVTKKENRVIMFGIFEQDLRELKKTNNIDFILDKLVPSRQEENEVPVNEINKISVGKDHVAILGKNQVYSWGFDNYTGRLGHGYTFLGRNKNIDRMEDDSEADQIGQLTLDLNQKFEKPEYCNYINKYLQEQLIEFKKKQITGGKEEYDKLSSSDYESEAESEGEGISVIEGEGIYPPEEIARRKRNSGFNTNATAKNNNYHNTSSSQSPSRPMNGKKYTVASSVYSKNFNTGGDSVMSRQNRGYKPFSTPRHQSIKPITPKHFVSKKDRAPIEKSSAQEAYIQFFLAPAVVKSTYEKLMSKDKPDLYSIINEPFGLLNEERILYLYDKVSSIQTEIQMQYSQCQAFLASNKQFIKASQSQILKRLSTEPFNVKFNEKNVAAAANPPYLLPFTNNKFL